MNDPFLIDLAKEHWWSERNRGGVASAHEAYGKLCEELAEFFEHVRTHRDLRDNAAMRQELIQIANVCWRTVKWLELNDRSQARSILHDEAPLAPEERR